MAMRLVRPPVRKPAPTYQGSPCDKGHDGTRYVKTRQCVACLRHRASVRRLQQREASL